MTTPAPWSEHDLAMVRRMTSDGFGCGFIGRNLGRTKSAVSARRKIDRMADMERVRADKEQRVDAMLKAGMNHLQIAEVMGIHRQWVGVIARRIGHSSVHRISQERVDQIADMLARGRSRATIARVLGVASSYVYYHVRRLGLVGPKTVSTVYLDQADENDRIRQMAREGMSATEIALVVGSSGNNVRSRLMTMALRDEVIEINGMAAVRYATRRAA